MEEEDQGDSWAQTLQKINEDREKDRAKEMATSGRGARRRAAAPKVKQDGSSFIALLIVECYSKTLT
jgi:hypothetical protein